MPKIESGQATKDKYYAKYASTTINSIEGLYNLKQYEPGEGITPTAALKAAMDSN